MSRPLEVAPGALSFRLSLRKTPAYPGKAALTASGALLALALLPSVAQAVVCQNAGAGPAPAAGTDGGGEGNTACGIDAVATGGGSTAFGNTATATGLLSTSVGFTASTTVGPSGHIAAVAIGANATGVGDGIAIGSVATANDGQGIALGVFSRAIAPAGPTNAIAIGAISLANGNQAIAIGGRMADGTGNGATATGNTAIAIGGSSVATGEATIAFGQATVADKTGATALGTNAQATGPNSIAIGGNTAGGAGFAAFASGANAIAIGNGSQATNANATALGNGATTTRDNQIAIGTVTNTYTTPGVVTNQSIADQSGPLSVVTTDANGNLAHILLSDLLPPVVETPCEQPFAGSLQCGTNSNASATQATAIGQTATASGVGSTAVGFGSVASGAGSTAQGQFSVASGNQSSAFGAGANASGAGSLALGAGSSATAPNSVALGSGSVASLANTLSVGAPGSERRITNVAAGINPTDAVNVSQLSSLSASLGSQIGGLQSQINNNLTEARRGIAAAISTANPPMPSLPGRTTWQLRTGFFEGQTGVGVAFAHRLDTAIPMALMAGYGNGGGTEHTGYVGLMGEF